MNIKRLAKQLTPPILADWYRDFKHGKQYTGHIWEGVYRNYQDVPVTGRGYDGDIWINETYAYTEAFLNNKWIGSPGQYALLPFLVSLVRNDSGLTILDFGGGMGMEYIHLTRSLPEAPILKYYVVEGQKICEVEKKLFAGDTRIQFCASLPKHLSQVDIVFIRSALQYIDDYKELLSQLAEYRPRFFLFVDLSAGKNPTYVSAQRNLRGSVISYWFINLGEFLELMFGSGYKLIFHGLQDREFDQSNFPEAYRLGHTCNLLFARQLVANE